MSWAVSGVEQRATMTDSDKVHCESIRSPRVNAASTSNLTRICPSLTQRNKNTLGPCLARGEPSSAPNEQLGGARGRDRLADATGTSGKRVRAPLPVRSPEPPPKKRGRGRKRKE